MLLKNFIGSFLLCSLFIFQNIFGDLTNSFVQQLNAKYCNGCFVENVNKVITQKDIPYVVTLPGNYKLGENICYKGTGAAITIKESNVCLDLDCHTIDLLNTAKMGIKVDNFDGLAENIVIKNGTIINSFHDPEGFTTDLSKRRIMSALSLGGQSDVLLQIAAINFDYGHNITIDNISSYNCHMGLVGAFAKGNIFIQNCNIMDSGMFNGFDSENAPQFSGFGSLIFGDLFAIQQDGTDLITLMRNLLISQLDTFVGNINRSPLKLGLIKGLARNILIDNCVIQSSNTYTACGNDFTIQCTIKNCKASASPRQVETPARVSPSVNARAGFTIFIGYSFLGSILNCESYEGTHAYLFVFAAFCTMKDCISAQGSSHNGVELAFTYHSSMQNCTFKGVETQFDGRGHDAGIRVSSCKHFKIEDCNVQFCRVDPVNFTIGADPMPGIEIDGGCSNMLVVGNVLEGNNIGIWDQTANLVAANNRYYRNIATNNTMTIGSLTFEQNYLNLPFASRTVLASGPVPPPAAMLVVNSQTNGIAPVAPYVNVSTNN